MPDISAIVMLTFCAAAGAVLGACVVYLLLKNRAQSALADTEKELAALRALETVAAQR